MSRGGFFRRFPVLGIRDFRLLLTDRLSVIDRHLGMDSGGPGNVIPPS